MIGNRIRWVHSCIVFLALVLLATAVQAGPNVVTYYHLDALGSPAAATDRSGNLKWEEHYFPFGIRILNDPASDNQKVWYTGKVQDKESGLVYMNARYYDPNVGRFYSVDPVEFTSENPMSFNRYLYANNNPYKYNDPTGEFINNIVGGVLASIQNIALQNLEISLGLRDQFSYTELAVDTAIGAATSGLSAVKNSGRVAAITAKLKTNTPGKKGAGSGGRGQQVGSIINKDGSTTASAIKEKAESLGFKPVQTEGGPLKLVDENGVARVTIKGGSQRTPGSANPHVELKDSNGQRVNPAGESVTRKSPENHTPIVNNL